MITDESNPDGDTTSMSLAEAAQLRIIEAAQVRLCMVGARLDMVVAGDKTYEKVSIRRAFPLSHPTQHHSVRDSEKKEIGVLRGIENLDAASRRFLDLDLERRYMVAIIKKVVKITERFGTVDWDVETDRGPCRFTTRDLRDNATRMGPSHYLLNDVENNRFEVLDLNALDLNSQSLLNRYL